MKLIVCNLKTYQNKNDFDNYIEELKELDLKDVVIVPSYIYLDSLFNKDITIGSQDVSASNNKNYTGEVTSSQLKSLNIKYSIVGHSERGENNSTISTKVNNLLKEGISPILCIGEKQEDRKNNTYKKTIKKKMIEILNNTKKQDISKIIIAYEPIWSIGSGMIPTNEEIKDIVTYIKDTIKENYNADIRVLYGGSISSNNIDTLNTVEELYGYLIGKASTNTNELKNIIDSVKKHKN